MSIFSPFPPDLVQSDNNDLEGNIPFEYIADLPSVTEINLSNNRFSGLVKDEQRDIWGMQNLVRFNICKSTIHFLIYIYVYIYVCVLSNRMCVTYGSAQHVSRYYSSISSRN